MAQGCQTPDDNWCLTEQAHHQACTAAAASGDDVGVATCEWCPARRPAGPVKVPHHSLFSAIPFSLWGAPFLSRSITLLLTHSNTHSLSLLCAHSLSCSLSRTRALSLSRFSMAFRMGFLVRGFVNKRPW